MFDLIIIGASAAGISASIYAARRRLNFKVISKDFGGEVATSGTIENWPGIVYTNGVELADMFRKHAEANNVVMEEGKTVDSIEKMDGFFVVSGKNSDESLFEEKSKTIIIATGVRPKLLNIPGEKEFKNKGVSYCSVCDGPLFSDKVVAIIGGGNSALESAVMLSEIAEKIYVINKNSKFNGEQILIDKVSKNNKVQIIYEADTTRIFGEDFVKGIDYTDKDGRKIELQVDGVFVHIGRVANSNFSKGVELNEIGEIKTDFLCRTNIPGIFAAGDVTSVPYKQIAIASGQGVTALLSAVDYLNKNN